MSMSSISSERQLQREETESNNESNSSTAAAPLKQPVNGGDVEVDDDDAAAVVIEEEEHFRSSTARRSGERRKMGLMWCSNEFCKDPVRERVVGEHNQILLNGPATGQVAYEWHNEERNSNSHRREGKNAGYLLSTGELATATASAHSSSDSPPVSAPSVYLLVKQGDDHLMKVAADAIKEISDSIDNINVLLDPSTAAKMKHYYGVDDDNIHLFEVPRTPGFGSNLRIPASDVAEGGWVVDVDPTPAQHYSPDLICTLGGDGLLLYAAMMFQGPVPPILCVAGGSLGFLTPFDKDEMVEAIAIALGMVRDSDAGDDTEGNDGKSTGMAFDQSNGDIDVFPPNMPSYPYDPLPPSVRANGLDGHPATSRYAFGLGNRICLSIRMRLDCRIVNPAGVVRARYNILNEVVIDRGSSPYLAALECFCDDVHLTTVQADGIIFATPTGSTAYSMAAGSAVVHPAVPCILVTPICPHVLSFRSMVFPDHVVLRCFVPEDARSDATVAFDGKHRQELRRGDSVQIQMSPYPVPTINREDHSSDWLSSLKRNFGFNARKRQAPL